MTRSWNRRYYVRWQTPDSFRIRFRTWFSLWKLVESNVRTGAGTAREFGALKVNRLESQIILHALWTRNTKDLNMISKFGWDHLMWARKTKALDRISKFGWDHLLRSRNTNDLYRISKFVWDHLLWARNTNYLDRISKFGWNNRLWARNTKDLDKISKFGWYHLVWARNTIDLDRISKFGWDHLCLMKGKNFSFNNNYITKFSLKIFYST